MQFKLPAVAALFAAAAPAMAGHCGVDVVVKALQSLETITSNSYHLVQGLGPHNAEATCGSFTENTHKELAEIDVVLHCDIGVSFAVPQQNQICGLWHSILGNQFHAQNELHQHVQVINHTPFASNFVDVENNYANSIDQFTRFLNPFLPVCAPTLAQSQQNIVHVLNGITATIVV